MKNKKKNLLIFTIILGIGIFITCGFTFAKYASNAIWNYYLTSKEFYFTSDELKEENQQNINNQWDGSSTYLTLKNSSNESNVTDYDISYKATCTIKNSSVNSSRCVLSGTNSDTFEGVLSSHEMCINKSVDGIDVSNYSKADCEVNGYEWTNKVASKDLYFDIIADSEVEDVTAVVTVTSTSPYKKTLTGEFILKKDKYQEKIQMLYHNYNNYDELVVTNSYNQKKCVNIKWDSSKLKIDYEEDKITSYEEDENGYINSINLTIPAKNNLNYKFYKLDKNNYNTSSFTLTEKDC